MKNPNSISLLIRIRSAMEELPVKTYQECNIKLGMMQALDQVIKDESPDQPESEVKPDEAHAE